MISFHQITFTPWALVWGLGTVAIVYGLHFLYLWHRGHHKPHVKALLHFHYHLITGLIVALFIGIVVGVTIYRGTGVKYNAHLHIKPDARLVKAGAPYSYSLAAYLPPVVLNQGQTNACLAFAMSEARYMEDVLRGETPPDVFSGFYTYYWATGGANVPTSVDQEAHSIINHGVTLWGNMPYFGSPSQAAINASAEGGGSYRYLFYNFGGQGSLNAIKATIASGQPVILLIQVHDGFQNSFNGASYTDNSGNFVDYHAVLAYAYDGNNFYVRNSWGSGYGSNGNIMLTSTAMVNTIIGAAVISPSPQVAFYVPAPPVHKVKPHAKPKPKVKPKLHPAFSVLRATHLRFTPKPKSFYDRYLIKKGWKLVDLKKFTPHWRYVETLDKHHKGWILKRLIRRITK